MSVSKAVSKEQVAAFVEESTREQGVPLHVEDPETLQKVATLLNVPRTEPVEPESVQSAQATWEALALLREGYHVDWVAKRVGVPVERLRRLVGKDGYAK